MFHVYYVNDGCMLMPQTSHLGGVVLDLQKSICDETNVDVTEQVLYLSNGELVPSNSSLSAYVSAGSESDPIFMVRRMARFDPHTFVARLPERDEINTKFQSWQHTVETVERTSTNSTSINDFLRLWHYGQQLEEKIYRTCAKYLIDHRYLYQGWLAMVKNLSTSSARVQRHVERNGRRAERLDAMRKCGMDDLADFDFVLKTLAKITVPSQLLSTTFRTTASSSSSTGSSGTDEISLYDWISSTDPSYSLNDIFGYLVDDLQNTNDADLREAQERIKFVYQILNDEKQRDIGGVDRRITTIEYKLRKIEEKHFDMIAISEQMLKEVATTTITYHRRQLAEYNRLMSEMYSQALSILNSKEELIRNICTRIANFIQRGYERLSLTNKSLMVFEEKYGGLRDRLRLVRQIREAPILYVTAVAEVIRREALQKEFSAWISTFTEKCAQFISDENKIRTDFYSKLGEHFLRNIFFDLSDQMPDFLPHVAPFDGNLPRVNASHLRELRKNFPEMHELLNVTKPQVYARLAVVDRDAQSSPTTTTIATVTTMSSAQSQTNFTCASITQTNATAALGTGVGGAPLRRDESFFVREQTTNIETINENFPTANWLNEEHLDMSPASQFFLSTKAAAGGLGVSTSNASLHIDTLSLASPMELGPLTDFTLGGNDAFTIADVDVRRIGFSSYNNAGQSIPNNNNSHSGSGSANGNGTTIANMDVSSSTVRQYLSSSGRSCSPFGTPDSTFECEDAPPSASSVKVIRPSSLFATTSGGGATTAATISDDANAERNLTTSMEIFSPSSELSEQIRTKCADVTATISDFFVDLRASVASLQNEMRAENSKNANTIRENLSALQDEHQQKIDALNAQKHSENEERMNELRAEFERRNKELSDIVEHERYLRKEKESELHEQRRVAEKLNEDLLALIKAKDDLHIDLLKAEQERIRLKEQHDAEFSMDYLQIELKAVEQLLKRELTSEEVQEIKREIEKRKISKSEESSLNSDTQSPAQSAAADLTSQTSAEQSKKRSEYEKAFRSKMELIVRGVEEKKNSEMAAQRYEIEVELRKEADAYMRRLKERIVELEDRVAFFEYVDEQRRKREAELASQKPQRVDSQLQVFPGDLADAQGLYIAKSSIGSVANDESVYLADDQTEDAIKEEMNESKITMIAESSRSSVVNSTQNETGRDNDKEQSVNEKNMEGGAYQDEENVTTSNDEAEFTTVAVPVLLCDKNIQTRLRLRDMDSTISLRNIHEGCSVLILWNNVYNTYVILCTYPMLYIVREQSMHRMGVTPSDPSKRRGWMFVTVDHIEVCQIRKAENRYNLPMNTRFNWVTVLPLKLDGPAGYMNMVAPYTRDSTTTTASTVTTTTS